MNAKDLSLIPSNAESANVLDSENGNLDADEKELFEAIPSSGESIGNKSLRQNLNWDEEKYWRIRDGLINKSYVSTGMGRGGSVFRLKHLIPPPQSPVTQTKDDSQTEYRLERDLYAPFAEALKKWAKELQFGNFFVEDVSSQGSRRTGGVWTRPDLLLVSVETYQFVPNKFLEVITFEVKPSDGWAIEAVFEAAAHSRFASRSYLAIHLDAQSSPPEELQDRISEECKRFGVGLIVFTDPASYDSYDFRVEPSRKSYDPREVEKFIETQVSTQNKTQLSRWLR